MRVLVLGSGGREHTFVWKLSQSNKITKIYAAPGNAGTANLAENVDVSPSDFQSIENLVLREKINMVVVGPEQPLVEGIVDFFHASEKMQHVHIIGPSSKGARLEGSKDFAKIFMDRYGIPTARYKTFQQDEIEEAVSFMETLKPPYVLKADGLAAGKGVVILDTIQAAKEELQAMFAGKFGQAGKQVLIEEFLDGIELSVFVLTDGKNYVLLPEAKDYKRIGKNDTGPNTGGMGSISPVPFAQGSFLQKVEEQVVKPTIRGINEEQMDYIGFVFIGLMNCNGEPKVIEYNVRMGDPETQSVIPRIETDFLDLLLSATTQSLNQVSIKTNPDYAATVVLVADGYPESYQKGDPVTQLNQVAESTVFHAGTTTRDEHIVTNGGRVLSVSATGKTMQDALNKCFADAGSIQYRGKYYRNDIGFDLK